MGYFAQLGFGEGAQARHPCPDIPRSGMMLQICKGNLVMSATFTAREFSRDASKGKRAKGKKTKVPLVAFLEGLPLGDLDLARERDGGV